MAATTPTIRIVPGAPPPPPLSKSQKRKRKSNKTKTPDSPLEGSPICLDVNFTTPLDKAPEESEAKESAGAVELVAASEAPTNDDALLKPSPAVELLQKRMRALNKKIVCFQYLHLRPSATVNEFELLVHAVTDCRLRIY